MATSRLCGFNFLCQQPKLLLQILGLLTHTAIHLLGGLLVVGEMLGPATCQQAMQIEPAFGVIGDDPLHFFPSFFAVTLG